MKDNSDHMKLNLLVSISLAFVGIICNQWTVGQILTEDGVIDDFLSKLVLWFLQIIALVISICIFRNRNRIVKKHYLLAGMTFLLLLGFTILSDYVLGFVGLPSEPEQQWVHPPNYMEVRKSIGEFEYEFATNSQGLRYREIPLNKKSPNEKRILVVGDSFTEGQGVEQEETFSFVLESYYSSSENNVYFINAGLTGTGPREYMYALLKVGLKYNIDGVLICLYANDVSNTTDAATFTPNTGGIGYETVVIRRLLQSLCPRIYVLLKKAERHYRVFQYQRKKRDIIQEARRKARKRGISEEVIESWIAKIPENLLDAANNYEFNGAILTYPLLAPDYWSVALDIETESANRKWQNMKKILDFTCKTCLDASIEVGIIFIPSQFQYRPDSHNQTNLWVQLGADIKQHWLTDTSKVQQYLYEWSKSVGLPYLDLTDEFRKAVKMHSKAINYPLDGHWTPLGHQIAADAIAKWLKKTKFLQLENVEEIQRNDKEAAESKIRP